MSSSGLAPDSTAPNPRLGAAVLPLDDAAAMAVDLTGAKAANLARCAAAGLPVLPGFVITTTATAALSLPPSAGAGHPVAEAWSGLSDRGQLPLVIRSSSVAEDSSGSSMAGRFVSVLDVRGWDAFVAAIAEVLSSAASTEAGDVPMAVLVQPMASARVGGVLFGLNPLTGERNRLLASFADGLPEQIVSGAVDGTTITVGRHGRIRSVNGPVSARLSARERRGLTRLAARTERLFGSPQDMEWLIEPDGTLRLLQSRPITAAAVPPQRSRVLGPGPVAETFPEPLAPLERDLWVPPLEAGLREAVRLSGAVGRRAMRESFVADVDGRVAVDLHALGVLRPDHRFWRLLDPRPGARHLRAAWRIGRLSAAMPAIVADAADEVDRLLADLPSPGELGDQQLLTVLDNAGRTLVGLHTQEVLAGFFLGSRATATTGASMAVATVAKARLDGVPESEIPARFPVALALLPPRIAPIRPLPPTPAGVRMPTGEADDPMMLARETMRLRSRWVQELGARAALELGRRLAARGQLHYPEDVRDLTRSRLDELVGALDIAVAVEHHELSSPPLPAVFRLAADGRVVPDLSSSHAGATGVSPGRARATVTHNRAEASGAVLVSSSLDPDLAGVLPGLAALVAGTGSPLSHLAILAREYQVPVVVGFTGPLADGSQVIVDGTAGTVEVAT